MTECLIEEIEEMTAGPTLRKETPMVTLPALAGPLVRRRAVLVASLLLAAHGAALAQSVPAVDPATPVRPVARTAPAAGDTAVAAVVRALFAAAERNDLVALDTLYAGDSLTVVEGAGINRGWADYRDHHLAPEMKEMKNFRYRPFEIEARQSGPLAWAIFRYALQAEVAGKVIDNVGRGTAILERRGSKWIVRHTQTTSRARRPGDPAMPQPTRLR